MKKLLFTSFLTCCCYFHLSAQKTDFVKCKFSFSYQSSNWKYGIVNQNGEKIAEPTYTLIENFSNKFYQNFAVFKDDDHYGVIDSKGNILVSDAKEKPNYDKHGHFIWYHELQSGNLVLYSTYKNSILGKYEDAYVAKTDRSIPHGHSFIAVVDNKENKSICINEFGETCTNSMENIYKNKPATKCKNSFYIKKPENTIGVFSTKINLPSYSKIFPDLEIINEYYKEGETLGLLAKKNHYYGLTNNDGKEILPFEYSNIKEEKGFLFIFKGNYIGLADLKGNIIYDPIYVLLSFDSDREGFLEIKTKKMCTGYCDWNGNIFLPEECKVK